MRENMPNRDIEMLVKILAESAYVDPVGPHRYFKQLVLAANIPARWKWQIADSWSGNPEFDARTLVHWAIAKKTNELDPGYTTLGSILAVLVPPREAAKVGIEDARTLACLIIIHELYHDETLLGNLRERYYVPLPYDAFNIPPSDHGPAFDWQGPLEKEELQGYYRPQPDLREVAFLRKATTLANAVCRVEIPQRARFGTAFLVAPDLILTNYHVFNYFGDEDIDENVRIARLRFAYYTDDRDDTEDDAALKLSITRPIVTFKPTAELDYILLRMESRIQGVDPVQYDTQTLPHTHSALHILQHPGGEVMKIALGDDGVTSVLPDRGRIQYVTKAFGGSSGAPCFNENWKLVALHHAQRKTLIGTFREGIIFSKIYQEIKEFL